MKLSRSTQSYGTEITIQSPLVSSLEWVQHLSRNYGNGTKPCHLLHDLITDPINSLHSLFQGIMKRHLQVGNLVFQILKGLDISIGLSKKSFLILFLLTGLLYNDFRGIIMTFLLCLKSNLQLNYPGNQCRMGVILQRVNDFDLLLQLSHILLKSEVLLLYSLTLTFTSVPFLGRIANTRYVSYDKSNKREQRNNLIHVVGDFKYKVRLFRLREILNEEQF